MPSRSFQPPRRRTTTSTPGEGVRKAIEMARSRRRGYRERSLELFGWICARCAREFDASNVHLLTVHHRDGNHHNNPPDGSNWENLCVDCHEAEHSVGRLADYLSGRK